jgi:hypothetical protein
MNTDATTRLQIVYVRAQVLCYHCLGERGGEDFNQEWVNCQVCKGAGVFEKWVSLSHLAGQLDIPE